MAIQHVIIIFGLIACQVCLSVDWNWNRKYQLLPEDDGDSIPLLGGAMSEYGDDKYDLPPEKAINGDSFDSADTDDNDDDKSNEWSIAKEESSNSMIKNLYIEGSSRACRKEPPFIYATLHDYSNVLKYSLDGCLLDHEVLVDMPIKEKTELRSLAVSTHPDMEGHLYVANAASSEPQLMLFGKCKEGGKRYFKETIVSKEGARPNLGAEHAYGIAMDADYNIYTSFQHTDVVLRFDASTFAPMGLPPALQMSSNFRSFYKGTFHQFGRTGEHSSREQGIRGIVMVGHRLWIANENVGGVEVVDTTTGLVTDIIMVESPVGLVYSPKHERVFIGSKKKHWEGSVIAVDRHTLRQVASYRTEKMTHPTGLAVWEDTLLVAEQFLNHIFAFDIPTQKNLGKVVDKFPGEVEQIMLSDC